MPEAIILPGVKIGTQRVAVDAAEIGISIELRK
jgi:hypothetical protein